MTVNCTRETVLVDRPITVILSLKLSQNTTLNILYKMKTVTYHKYEITIKII